MHNNGNNWKETADTLAETLEEYGMGFYPSGGEIPGDM